MKPPIFILGVPRSGTTLLRTLLDSHSAIACGPETPWLGGHQPRSVMDLWRFLREHDKGYCASYRMDPQVATDAARALVQTLMDRYAAARGKRRWAEKTPDNVLYIGFLLELFPQARVILLSRDGLDVALSTSSVPQHRKNISPFLERHLGLGPGVPPVENNPLTALLRWRHWNSLADQALAGRECLRVRYEHLVTEPETTLRRITEFVDEPFEPAMIDYSRFRHDFPGWEWGSADVQTHAAISRARIGRARREFSQDQLAVLEPLVRPGAARDPARDPAALLLTASFLSGFSAPLGLGAALPDQAWLWLHGLCRMSSSRILCAGDSKSSAAWAAALLGSRVTFIGPHPEPAHLRLRDNLRAPIEWQPHLPSAPADAMLLPFPSAALPIRELAGALRPGGTVAACIRNPAVPEFSALFDIRAQAGHDSPAGPVTTLIAQKRA